MDTLTVSLDDQASRGLQDLADKLDNIQKTSEQTAQGTDKLSEATERQTQAIKDGVSWYSAFKIAVVDSFVKNGAAAGQFFVNVVKGSAEAVVGLIGVQRAVAALAPVIEKVGAPLIAQAEKWGLVEKAAAKATGQAIASTVGLGTAFGTVTTMAAGAGVGLKVYEAVLANTGKQERLTTEAQERIARSLAYTDEQFQKMPEGIQKTEIALDRMNAAAGRTLADDLEKGVSNLERASEEWGKVGNSASAAIGGIQTAASEFASGIAEKVTEPLRNAWDILDKDITARQEFATENLRYLREKTLGNSVPTESTDNFEKVKKAQEENAAGYDRLREANEKLSKAADARAENERINSIKTIEGINAEIAKHQEAAAKDVRSKGGFTAADQKAYEQEGLTLQSRRAAIVKEIAETEKKAAEDKKKSEKEIAEAIERGTKEGKRLREERLEALAEEDKKQREIYELEQKRLLAQREMVATVGQHAQDNAEKYGVTIEKEKLDIFRQQRAERMKMQGYTDSQIKTADYELEKRQSEDGHKRNLNNIDSEFREKANRLRDEQELLEKSSADANAKAKERIKLNGEIDKLTSEYLKKRHDEDLRFRTESKTAELQQAAQIEEEKFRLVRERHEKEKQLLGNALGQQFNAQAALNSFSPEQVLAQLQKQRRDEYSAKQAAVDSDLKAAADAGDKGAAKQFDKNQKTVKAWANADVMKDFQGGKLKDGEVAMAEAELARNVVQAGQSQGYINNDVAKMMTEQINMTAGQIQANDMMQKALKQLAGVQQAQKGALKNQADNLKNQMGGLFP